MGASFAEDAGLEMAPPLSGQLAFLEGLRRISADQLAKALATMRRKKPKVEGGSGASAEGAGRVEAAPGAVEVRRGQQEGAIAVGGRGVLGGAVEKVERK